MECGSPLCPMRHEGLPQPGTTSQGNAGWVRCPSTEPPAVREGEGHLTHRSRSNLPAVREGEGHLSPPLPAS